MRPPGVPWRTGLPSRLHLLLATGRGCRLPPVLYSAAAVGALGAKGPGLAAIGPAVRARPRSEGRGPARQVLTATRSSGPRRRRMTWLVDPQGRAIGQPDRGQQAPASVGDFLGHLD